MPTIDVAVAASNQDAFEATNGGCIINGALWNVDETLEWGGVQFHGITIPAGATITASYLSFAFSSSSVDEPDVTIYGEDTATPGVFTTGANNLSGRSRTAASVAWNSADLGATTAQVFNSPSLNTIIQELVDSYTYSSAVMSFLITSTNGTATRDFGVDLWDHATSAAPALHIEYTEAGGGLSIPIVFHRRRQMGVA